MDEEARPRSRRMLYGCIAFTLLTLSWVVVALGRNRNYLWEAGGTALLAALYGWLYSSRRR